jgi:hypothetical protein
MWVDTQKIEETDTSVTYLYGYETHELTGKFVLSKGDDSVTLLEKDKDYGDWDFAWIAGQVGYRLPRENYPDKRMIATG